MTFHRETPERLFIECRKERSTAAVVCRFVAAAVALGGFGWLVIALLKAL